ncbi:ribbon-helix-helix protein, CopG family [Allorhizocola rhizosphaerae]|uniref:ribbon-helix-helix protein, CopG family n=1 Tax=Allorhizocola rhizosphaerae TaxID=1872709 RepID=UPI0013C2C515|nr:ribbon-helix-helix protein, CopG family [Allorhizocola rhizosphaerae]
MKTAPATISFSVDTALKDDLDKIAAEEGRSKSDLFREMYNSYMFKRALRRVQDQGVLVATRLGLQTDEDVYRYLDKGGAA